MTRTALSDNEIAELGERIYYSRIRAVVETPNNIGKLVSIDVETGDYEIGDDRDIEAPLRLHAKHPGAAIYTLRIGYKVTVSFGGVIERRGGN